MKEIITQAIQTELKNLGVDEVDFTIEHPKDLSHGDYASNVALVVAKQIGKAPREVAEQLLAGLVDKVDNVTKTTVAGPGFINFFLSSNFFSEKITHILEQKNNWGKNNSWQGKKVIVEYTDANPFKEFHIGHLFTNSVGESIARLFMMNGADTKRVCYQGDVGLHVACSLWGMQSLGYSGTYDFTAQELGKAYAHGATAYKEDIKAKEEIKFLNKEIYERNDEVINALYDKGRKVSLAYFESVYEVIDTKFDYYFFESEVAEKGKQIVLDNPDIFPESDGARVFEGEKYGLHTRVFLNSEGLPTYEAKELALAHVKEEVVGEYNLSVISTSNEILEYFKVLKKAMSFIYPELEKKTEHIGHGTVCLSDGKMSSRTGKIISAINFIDEIATAAVEKMQESGTTDTDYSLARDIAIGAIKYATLKGNILQDSVFDKEQALSFEGNSGPYLMYTHARICSVLEKATQNAITPNLRVRPLSTYEVERIIYRFPEVVEEALATRTPHKVIGFLTELASTFNSFYAQEKIADPIDEFAPYKTALAEAVAQTIRNGLWILAIKAPEKM